MEVLIATLGTFASTNIDDGFLLSILFAQRIPARRIVAGQYLGFGIIVVVSLVATLAALSIPHRWIRFLGLAPLALGIKCFFKMWRTRGPAPTTPHVGVVAIALVTASCGADNVGIYVPFFVFARAYLWFILASYAVLLALWCLVARWIGTHVAVTERWSDRIVPWIFILLGVWILIAV